MHGQPHIRSYYILFSHLRYWRYVFLAEFTVKIYAFHVCQFVLCVRLISKSLNRLLFLFIGRYRRSQWPRGIRRSSAANRLLRSWVQIPTGTWMFVCCECSVLTGRGLRRAHHSSRGVLPSVMRRCVWSRNIKKQEFMARVGSQRHVKGVRGVRELEDIHFCLQ